MSSATRETISTGLERYSKLKGRSSGYGRTYNYKMKKRKLKPRRTTVFSRFSTPTKKATKSLSEIERSHRDKRMLSNDRSRSTPRGSRKLNSRSFRRKNSTDKRRTKLKSRSSSSSITRNSRPTSSSSRKSSVTKLPKIESKSRMVTSKTKRRGTPRLSRKRKRLSRPYPSQKEKTSSTSQKSSEKAKTKSVTTKETKKTPKYITKSIYDDYNSSSRYVMSRVREMDEEKGVEKPKRDFESLSSGKTKYISVKEKKEKKKDVIVEESDDDSSDDGYGWDLYSSYGRKKKKKDSKRSLESKYSSILGDKYTRKGRSTYSTSYGSAYTSSYGTSRIASSSTTTSKKVIQKHTKGLVGLRNLFNTCYMNSALQVLSNIPPLRDYFLKKSHHGELNIGNSTKGRVAKYFGYLLESLWTSTDFTCFSPTEFKRVVTRYAPRFMGYDQHDSQEFLKFLLDGIHEDLNRVKRKPKYEELKDFVGESEREKSIRYWDNFKKRNDSVIVDLFGGQLVSTLTCTKCKNVSTSYDPFFEISLPLPRVKESRYNWLSLYNDQSRSYDLSDCFDLFMEEERLKGNEKPFCSSCKKRRVCMKRLQLCKLPSVLVILLKRFESTRRKILHDIDFPLKNLDLKSYMWKDMNFSNEGTRYRCIGVINHLGGLFGGHYTCYAKNEKAGGWASYNDSHVRTISSRTIQSSAAYCLVYIREASHK